MAIEVKLYLVELSIIRVVSLYGCNGGVTVRDIGNK